MKSRILSCFLIFALCISTLSACGSDTAPSDHSPSSSLQTEISDSQDSTPVESSETDPAVTSDDDSSEGEADVYKRQVINNAAYELIVALTAKSAPPRKFELSIPQWDDLMIANIVENAINAIDERIGYYCHPFYHEVDKLPCYLRCV